MTLYVSEARDVIRGARMTDRWLSTPDGEDYILADLSLYVLISHFIDLYTYSSQCDWRDSVWSSTVGAKYRGQIVIMGEFGRTVIKTETPFKGYSLISLYWANECLGTIIVRRDTGEFVGSVSSLYEGIYTQEAALVVMQFREYNFG